MQLQVEMGLNVYRSPLLVALSASLLGCYTGADGDGGPTDTGPGDTDPGTTADASASAGESGSGDESGGSDSSEEPPVAGCEDVALSVGDAPMRRLTRGEYDNTVRDLLSDASAPSHAFVPDEIVAGFAANSVAPVSGSQIDQYFDAAETLAATAVEGGWDTVVGCDPSDADCLDAFIDDFGLRAFRRRLTDDESSNYHALYASAAAGDPRRGVEVVLTAMLMAPAFLYHAEAPRTDAGSEVALLDNYAVASRLSYFVWSSMPDEELFELAGAGMLDDPDVLEQQVRRMLDDGRAADAMASFHRQWLHIDGLDEKVKDPAVFPQWNPELAQSMEHESIAFADEVIRRGDGSLTTLLTAPWSVIDADLGALYGVAGPSVGFAVTDLNPNERAGVLTHASFLASNAHASENSWVHRGLFVRESLLCGELPPPPPGVEVNDPNDPNRLEDPTCVGCHIQIDPIGKAFDAYSAIGTYARTNAAGDPVDVSGSVSDFATIGDFEGVLELAEALTQTPKVGDCVASQWFRYATRRHEAELDECAVARVQATFAESGNNIPALIVALVRSDAFRYQAPTP